MVDSLFVGETENIGNPRDAGAAGRSLPFPKVADFPIRGYEFYDFHHELDNNTFVNYQDNATRKTGAISYLLFTSFGMSSNNTVQRSKFINAKPVYFRRSTTGGATMITATRSTRPRCSMTRTAPSPVSPIPTSSTSPESTSTTPARSSPPGTLWCARAMSGA